MKKTRKAFSVILAFAIIVTLASCTRGSYSVLMGNETNTSNKMSMAYEEFNGYNEREIEVSEGKTFTLNIDIVTDSGKLDMSIISKKSEEVIFERDDLVTSEFTFEISQSGKYIIKFEGIDHYGSYCVEW